MLLSELTAVWQSTARPKAPRKAAWDDPRAQTPALVARTRPKSQHPTCQQQQAPPQFFPHLWKYFLNHCLSSHVLLLQNIETAWQPHALQEGKQECRHANSWPQNRSSLWKHTLKKKKKAFFLVWDLDIVQPNYTGHTAKQHLQGAFKQGKSGISPSWMKVDSVDCSSPPQSSALPVPADLVLTFFLG